MTTKTNDRKGRLTLGERFANRTVIVEEIDDTAVRLTPARVVPEREMWLQENRAAAAAVSRGLVEARAGKLSSVGPDLAADAAPAVTFLPQVGTILDPIGNGRCGGKYVRGEEVWQLGGPTMRAVRCIGRLQETVGTFNHKPCAVRAVIWRLLWNRRYLHLQLKIIRHRCSTACAHVH